MADINDFNGIRPLEPSELPAAYEELLANPSFQKVVGYVFPQIPFEGVAATMRQCKTNLEFQAAFCKPFLEGIVKKCSKGLSSDFSANPEGKNNLTYISNHRDIVLDSGFLDLLLLEKTHNTVEIAIGDNLLIYPWIKTLVRINRSFIVTRTGGLKEILTASTRLSNYIHFAINEKNTPVWIAQREGRSKDSMDETQESLLKMLSIGGEGSLKERIRSLNLTPLAISYQYDPCDWLKAQEYQLKRDNADYHKTPADDLQNMQTGIFGYKGFIHYQTAPCINDFVDSLPDDISKTEFFSRIAKHIDQSIYKNYRLYPNNYIALDLLHHTNEMEAHYSKEEKKQFEEYLNMQHAKIRIENKDDDFLWAKMLEMYANPAIHQLELS